MSATGSNVSLSTLFSIDDHMTAAECVARAREYFGGRLVLSTSFGIQSAVLLHLVTREIPDIPVIWIDTGYLPAETYRYADTLTRHLGLNLHIYQSTLTPAHMEALYGRLWESGRAEDLDQYHWVRKLEPMQRALTELGATAWLSGIRRSQTSHRQTLSPMATQWGVIKIHPILSWNDAEVTGYLDAHALPRHPLEEQGYQSVGDAQLSAPAAPAPRSKRTRNGRFNDLREECGLHLNHAARFDFKRVDSL